ncbi:MAG: Uma2 family endonuclease [Cyanobacteria bacterium J06648_16]
MTVTTYRWTLERYHHAVDAGVFDDQPVELLRGEIVVMPPEGEPHAYYNTCGADYLRRLLGARVQIRDAKPITLPNNSEPEPDIAVVKPLNRVYLQHHPYPEDIFWLVEYSNSSLKKDLDLKQAIYAEAGIQEYWVVNLQQRRLIVFRDPRLAVYQTEQIFSSGTISPAAFPEVAIALNQFLPA